MQEMTLGMIHTAVSKEEVCLAFCTRVITDIGCSVYSDKVNGSDIW